MAFAITEPDAGSNSHNISTTAMRDGDVYRLNGTKYYISGCDESQAMLVVSPAPLPTRRQDVDGSRSSSSTSTRLEWR